VQALRLLVRYRMLVAAVALPLGFLLGPEAGSPAAASRFLAVSGAVAGASAFYLLGLAWGRAARVQMAVQLALDLAVVTWIAAITGGRESQFVLFYVLVVLTAGVLFEARGGVAAALLAGAAYGALPWLGGAAVASRVAHLPTWPMLVGVFLAVGLLGGYLGWSVRRTSARLESAAREVAEAAREVEQVRLDTERILASMSSGVLTLDRNGVVLHVNHAAAEILGTRSEALRGRRCSDALGPGQEGLLSRLLETLRTGQVAHRQEVRLVRPDGTTRPIGVSTSILTDESGEERGTIAVIADLSEIKAAEERARRSETLAAIGQLSAHIAHEIRNAVVPIAGSVELLERELHLNGENRRLLDLVSRECARLNRFVTELLDYVREPELRDESVCLNDVARDVMDLARRHPRGRGVRFVLDDDGLMHWARADGEQMKRAFLNLAQNAVEAMEPGGELVVRLSARGARTAVQFIDRGSGIRQEDLARILDPFFTTKRGGTGLGLAIAARVVERHGGSLSVASTVGAGTTVTVEFPQEAEERIAA
jgi:PAS domain S-box-containing protein